MKIKILLLFVYPSLLFCWNIGSKCLTVSVLTRVLFLIIGTNNYYFWITFSFYFSESTFMLLLVCSVNMFHKVKQYILCCNPQIKITRGEEKWYSRGEMCRSEQSCMNVGFSMMPFLFTTTHSKQKKLFEQWRDLIDRHLHSLISSYQLVYFECQTSFSSRQTFNLPPTCFVLLFRLSAIII